MRSYRTSSKPGAETAESRPDYVSLTCWERHDIAAPGSLDVIGDETPASTVSIWALGSSSRSSII